MFEGTNYVKNLIKVTPSEPDAMGYMRNINSI